MPNTKQDLTVLSEIIKPRCLIFYGKAKGPRIEPNNVKKKIIYWTCSNRVSVFFKHDRFHPVWGIKEKGARIACLGAFFVFDGYITML